MYVYVYVLVAWVTIASALASAVEFVNRPGIKVHGSRVTSRYNAMR